MPHLGSGGPAGRRLGAWNAPSIGWKTCLVWATNSGTSIAVESHVAPSSPASIRPGSGRSTPLPRVDVTRLSLAGGEDIGVCFVIEGAPPASTRAEDRPDGSIRFRTAVRGVLVSAGPHHFDIDVASTVVRVRHLLPDGVSFDTLLGHELCVEVRQVFHPDRAPTIDGRVLATDGALLFWGRDGHLPPDQPALGIALRVAHDESGGPRLVFATAGGVTSVGPREVLSAQADDARFVAAVLRVRPDDASFLLVRV